MKWFIVLLLVSSGAFAAEAYKCKGKNGETIFSDQPCAKDAELVELKEPQTYSTPSGDSSQSAIQPEKKTENTVRYKTFEFSKPQAGAIFDDGTGNVSVQLVIVPRIQPGHKTQLFVNGVAQGEPGMRAQWNLSSLDRGEYQIRASLTDKNGRELSSATGSFAVVKHVPKPAK